MERLIPEEMVTAIEQFAAGDEEGRRRVALKILSIMNSGTSSESMLMRIYTICERVLTGDVIPTSEVL